MGALEIIFGIILLLFSLAIIIVVLLQEGNYLTGFLLCLSICHRIGILIDSYRDIVLSAACQVGRKLIVRPAGPADTANDRELYACSGHLRPVNLSLIVAYIYPFPHRSTLRIVLDHIDPILNSTGIFNPAPSRVLPAFCKICNIRRR